MSYLFVDDENSALGLCDAILSYKGLVGLDLETTGLDWMMDKILLMQLHMGETAYVVDIRKLGKEHLTRITNTILSSGNQAIIHNAKFDLKFLARNTGILLTNIYDTMLAEAILNAGTRRPYFTLEELVEKYTDYVMDKEVRKQFINFPDDMPFTESMLVYSALDVKVLPDIVSGQMEKINKTCQDKVLELENNLLPVVCQMELDGIRLDAESWLAVEAKEVEKRMVMAQELKDVIAEHAINSDAKNGLELADKFCIPVTGKARRAALEQVTDISLMKSWFVENFNLKSNKQMLTMFHYLGIKVPDTDKKTLKKKYSQNEVVQRLLSLREADKLIDTYGKNVVALISPVTGKIHTEYSSLGTATGRFSSSNPNLQNVPVLGGRRECFIPDDGFSFAIVDYSQQEYRLAGAVSGEPRIIEAYKSGSDMHTATAKILYGKEEVTKQERNRGKTVNFAILYGSTEYGLRDNLGISEKEASEIIKQFWKGYPVLDEFMNAVGNLILEKGYSSTPLGRRRYNLQKPTFMNSYEFLKWQSRVLREGKNHVIQGGGADILKIAMLEMSRNNPFGRNFRLLLQIHDELLVMVHDSIKEDALEYIKKIMVDVEQEFLGDIPAEVEGGLYKKWSK